MNYFKEEKDINIKELIISIILKWRSIFVVLFGTMLITFLVNIFHAMKYIDILGIKVVCIELAKHVVTMAIVASVGLISIYSIIFLFTDTIKSSQEFVEVCSLPVVGCLVGTEKKPKNTKFDKWLKKLNGVKYRMDDNEQHKYCIAKIIEKSVLNDEKKDVKKVVIVSSSSIKYAENVKNEIIDKLSKNIEINTAGDINIYPEAIDNIVNADYVLCVEYQGKSKYGDLQLTLSEIGRWNKKIIGIVIIGVDGL